MTDETEPLAGTTVPVDTEAAPAGELRICIDADCPSCGWPERWFSPDRRLFGCPKCDVTSRNRDGDPDPTLLCVRDHLQNVPAVAVVLHDDETCTLGESLCAECSACGDCRQQGEVMDRDYQSAFCRACTARYQGDDRPRGPDLVLIDSDRYRQRIAAGREGVTDEADPRAVLVDRMLRTLAFGLPDDIVFPLRDEPDLGGFYRRLRVLPHVAVAGETIHLDEPAGLLYVENQACKSLRGLPVTEQRLALYTELVTVFGQDPPPPDGTDP
jgi:hypothetical protein